jgi:CubicO group peptidase (beta-lactamase class C family)
MRRPIVPQRAVSVAWLRYIVLLGVAYCCGCAAPPQTMGVIGDGAPEAVGPARSCDDEEAGDPLLPRASEALTDVQRGALRRLCNSAQSASSAALIVIHKSQTLVDWRQPNGRGRLLPLSSITKVFDGMAVGVLVGDGRLQLDTPLSRFFPEWGQNAKARVTVEQLLRHTAGIERPADLRLMDKAPDPLAFARAVPLDHEPGTHFSYSNVGAELLVGVVQAASGLQLDEFVRERVFRPMGIERYRWYHDPTGAPYGYGGLWLSPHDLARVGEMLLRDGVWRGTRVLPHGWVLRTIDSATTQGVRGYGMLMEVQTDPRDHHRILAFGHGGDGYQHLFIAPRSQIVIVRMREPPDVDPVPFDEDAMRAVAVAFDGG